MLQDYFNDISFEFDESKYASCIVVMLIEAELLYGYLSSDWS